jgi:RNA-binding protein Musashi
VFLVIFQTWLANENPQIDPKRAIPRDEQEKTSKIFVGGVSQDTTDNEFREYFAQFGRVVDATLMMDKDTGRPRGFGFVTFESEAGVEACLTTDLEIHGKPIEVKKAQPRGNVREEEEAARRGGGGGGKFGRKGPGSNSGAGSGMEDGAGAGNQGAMAGMAGGGAMTPQLMAQYWQRMQQYFAMMQQQMAMNRGMNMNPAMMQMMQMQQMQQQMMAAAGRGGNQAGNPMANMNPQMMQQMQQMMNQAGPMNQDPQAAGVGSPQGDSGGNQAGYNAFEQQQQYDQQRRPNRDHQQQQQQPYGVQGGQGGFGMGGGGGGVTSWEGMYDDVPQPMMHQGPGSASGRGGFRGNRGAHHQQQQGPVDPAKAPPANAPTGPKNAGKPGANYRGGGRGGNRGFHPYARG